MADEILINDGGAPARILPFSAGGAITAGDILSIDSSGDVVPADTDLAAGHIEYMVGVSLTDAAAGDDVNVVSGKGIVVRATAGQLAASTVLGHTCAVTLESTAAGAGIYKVLIIGG